jgi:hypothetical protein
MKLLILISVVEEVMFRHQVRTISTYNNIVTAAIERDQIKSEQSSGREWRRREWCVKEMRADISQLSFNFSLLEGLKVIIRVACHCLSIICME